MSISLCLLWMLTLTTSTSVELQVIESSTSLTCPSLSTVTTLIGTATCRPVRMAVFTISVSCRGKEKNFMSPEVHVARYSWRLVHAGIYIYIKSFDILNYVKCHFSQIILLKLEMKELALPSARSSKVRLWGFLCGFNMCACVSTLFLSTFNIQDKTQHSTVFQLDS